MFECLSEREKEILTHVVNCRTNKEIAGSLYLEPTTVCTHIVNIYNKLCISGKMSRMKLLKMYMENL